MMQRNTYETVDLKNDLGFDIRFVTMSHNSPFHWHREIEILYILNGHATVNMDGVRHELNPLDAIVIDGSKIHEVIYQLPQTMGVCIHISRKLISRFLPENEIMTFRLAGDQITENDKDAYSEICQCLKEIVVLYVNQKKTYQLQSTSLILRVMAILIEAFSEKITENDSEVKVSNIDRLSQVCDYVEHNYTEEITLQEVADELGLNKEYFCRFFKNNTGTTFINYVNQVRINHIYHEILHTDDSIQEIAERHGFFNQKLFYRMFKTRFNCTPREARKMARNNPYV